MGHGHHDPYSIPDYKIYKVENVPKLLRTQSALAAQGLRDPWLRNEVWRYDAKHWGTEEIRLKTVFGKGFKYGFGAFVATMVLSTAYDYAYPPKHGHDDHGHH